LGLKPCRCLAPKASPPRATDREREVRGAGSLHENKRKTCAPLVPAGGNLYFRQPLKSFLSPLHTGTKWGRSENISASIRVRVHIYTYMYSYRCDKHNGCINLYQQKIQPPNPWCQARRKRARLRACARRACVRASERSNVSVRQEFVLLCT